MIFSGRDVGDGAELKQVLLAWRVDADSLRHGDLAGGPVGKGLAASPCLLALTQPRDKGVTVFIRRDAPVGLVMREKAKLVRRALENADEEGCIRDS